MSSLGYFHECRRGKRQTQRLSIPSCNDPSLPPFLPARSSVSILAQGRSWLLLVTNSFTFDLDDLLVDLRQGMPVSPALAARRSLVQVLLALAAAYGVLLTLTRDARDEQVVAAYKKVTRKVHPDKGGSTADFQRLQAAKDEWEAKRSSRGQAGRPQSQGKPRAQAQAQQPRSEIVAELADPEQVRKSFRIQSGAVLLTYNGVRDVAQWHRFVAFVNANFRRWGVCHWCATLEATRKGALHIHCMVQFRKSKDRDTRPFFFEGLKPRADPNDLLGEGWGGKCVQKSYNRGFFYVWADKIGTQRDGQGKPCVAGNYEPCWEDTADFHYSVKSKWVENLWQERKLTTDMWDDYLFKTRDSVLGKKRNLDACREREEGAAERAEMETVIKRIRSNASLFRPFPSVPQAVEWLARFSEDRLRYPLLLVLGPSHTGKTEWAKSLFKSPLELKIGDSDFFPEKMRSFKRSTHDGLVLDDVRDLKFLVRHQDKLQGKYDARVEFASTPGGQCAYARWLFKIPVAATFNYSTQHLELLEQDDFLGNAGNRVLVHWPPPAAAAAGGSGHAALGS